MATERSKLRLKDLKAKVPTAARLKNVRVPVDTLDGIDRLAKKLDATKTSVIVALLNEALAVAKKR